MGKKLNVLSVVVSVLMLMVILNSCTKRNPYDEINDKIIVLFQQGKYSEAEKLAKEALNMVKEKFGENLPKVAACLDTLSMIYYTQGKYDQVEPLYREILAIREKTLGPDHPDVVHVLENMVGLYKDMGKDEEAKKQIEQIERIRSQR